MCDFNDICPIHGRNDVRDAVVEGLPTRLVTYLDDKAVVTIDNPEFNDPKTILTALIGDPKDIPNMFKTLVISVGDGTIGDVMDARLLKERTLHDETFGDSMKGPVKDLSDEILTKWVNENHDQVLAGVKADLIANG